MATNTPNPQTLLFFFLLITTPPPSNSFSFVQCQTLLSIFHSLILRVANHRASRGDLSGSERAKLIAAKLERGLELGAKFLLITTPLPSNSFSIVQCQTLLSIFHSLMLRVANLRASRGDLSGSERAKLIAAKLELGLQLGAKLELGLELGFWNVMWSMGWYYVKNYAWRDMSSAELLAAVSDAKELMRSLNELTQMRSDEDRVAWGKRNYQNFLMVSNSIFRRLLPVFRQSGPIRAAVETVQKEVENYAWRDMSSAELFGAVSDAKELMRLLNELTQMRFWDEWQGPMSAAVETVQKEVVEGGLLWDCLELGSNDLKGFVQIFKDVALQFSSTYMLTPVISEREREKRNEKISVHRILSIPFVQKQGKKQLEEKKK